MGLDGYIRSTSKKNYAKMIALDEAFRKANDLKNKAYEETWKSYLESLNLPKTEYGSYDYNKYTEEQKVSIKKYEDAMTQIEIECGFDPDWRDEDGCDEQYWRKNWEVHEFIASNWCDEGEDNCTRVVLDEDRLRALKKEFRGCDVFKRLLEHYNDDRVVYYWAWY